MLSEPKFDLTYISLGGGRQSSALALCSAFGLHGVPKADCAIFADTGDEIKDTYDHIEKMRTVLEAAGIPIHVVKQGHLGEELVGMKAKAKKGYIVSIPAFTSGPDGEGILRRQCTQEYKLMPIQREVRALLGFEKGERIAGKKTARALIGISYDEIQRIKPSRVPWIENHYPLVDAKLRVEDCVRICQEKLGYAPVKSACRFCPFHDNRYWQWLKTKRPDEFEKACAVDEGIRDLSRAGDARPVFLHRSCKPLREIDFEGQDKSQLTLDGFGNECEGMCGV